MQTDPLDLAPCTFRRVSRGQTFCTRATDEFDQAVWTEVCAGCPVPGWLQVGICRHLDIGTEVGKNLAAVTPRAYTACRFFSVRLDGLERCRSCPEFSRWEPRVEQGQPQERLLAESIPADVLEDAMREALQRQAEQERVRLVLGCFRLGAPHCLRAPELGPSRVLVVPPASLRSSEPYRDLAGEVLKSAGVDALVFTAPLHDADTLCDLCLSVQQCPRVVIDLSEWDTGALFALGLAGGLGRHILTIRAQDTTPPFVPQGLPIFEYAAGEELAMLLVQGLGLEIKPQQKEAPETPAPAAAEADQPVQGQPAAEEEAPAAAPPTPRPTRQRVQGKQTPARKPAKRGGKQAP